MTRDPEQVLLVAQDSERIPRVFGHDGHTSLGPREQNKSDKDVDPLSGKVLWPPRKPMRCSKPLGSSGLSPRNSAWSHLTKVGSLKLPGASHRTASDKDDSSMATESLAGGTVREYLWENRS